MKNENDIVYAMAIRVKELADYPMKVLRLCAYPNQYKKDTRGELIEGILVEEFIREFPRQFSEE